MFGRELKKPLFVRGMTVMAVFLLLAAALGARLWYLQMIEADKYKTGAYEQYTTEISISPKRGTVFDRNMTPLAVSDTVETVFISPYEIAMQNENKAPDKMVDIAEQKNKIADFLSETLEVDRAQIIERMGRTKSKYQIIKKKVERETCDKIRVFINENKIGSAFIWRRMSNARIRTATSQATSSALPMPTMPVSSAWNPIMKTT